MRQHEKAQHEKAHAVLSGKSVAKCHSFAAQERGKRKCLLAGIGDDEEDEGEPSEGAKRLASVKNVQNSIISYGVTYLKGWFRLSVLSAYDM